MPELLISLARLRPLVLGSQSPRRRRLLTEAGVKFLTAVPEIDESFCPGEDPYVYARRLAEAKAQAVASGRADDEIVLGGDTVVVLDGTILDKPRDEAEAVATLCKLSGRRHTVCTALALAERSRLLSSGDERTDVTFNTVTEERIRAYVASGEPLDKAGAYGIQGMGAFLVDTIEGNLDNVIGLPLTLLDRLAGQTLRLLGLVTGLQ
jgi:septum formation protein